MGRVLVKVARLGPLSAAFSALCVALCVTGCAGGSSAPPPPPVLSVSLSSTSASVQAGIGTQNFTATVQNDSQSKGVTWSLSGMGCAGATCGSLSATSSASGVPITYTAPLNQPNPSGVTLTATSVADISKSNAAAITVTPAVSVSVSPPTPINVQFNAIQDFTAMVQNDSHNKGVNWTLTQSGANCSPVCGTLSASSSASGVPVRYTGPSSVPANPSVTLTATSAADAARSAPANITVTVNQGNTSVTLSPARAAITKWQTQTFTATVMAANDRTVTWQVDTIPNGNATVGTIDSNGKYTPPSTAGAHTITVVSNADVTKSVVAPIGVTDLPGVYTYHNDVSRSGANIQEYGLTTSLATQASFGKLFSCDADAAIYAQPLWVANLTIGGASHNLVFVATERNTVYAFDADANPCSTFWQTTGAKSLIPSGETWVTSSDVGCGDLVPDIGITGTPVIDPATSTLYVVTKTKTTPGTPATFHQRLHALSILDGSEKFGGPVDIQASVKGNGNGSSGGMVAFDPFLGGQRPALLLDSGHVIISWASHCDSGPYHGWAMSYALNGANALAREAVFNTSPNGALSGVWMSGNGPAADASGNIYFATGNGSWDGNTNFGDSIVKLGLPSAGSFPAANFDYFTPINQDSLSSVDEDLGSGGLLLLPDIAGAHPHLLVQAGKEGKIYLVDRDNMGHILCSPAGSGCSGADTQIVQEIPNAVGGMWDSPAYWNGNLFFLGAGDNLKAFSFNAAGSGALSNVPISQSNTGVLGFPGATPSVSASLTTNGIVWLIDTNSCGSNLNNCSAGGPAILHAYDAANVATEFWNSSQVASDQAGIAVKFNVPTVANGKVYIGTRGNDAQNGSGTPSILGELDDYGLKPN